MKYVWIIVCWALLAGCTNPFNTRSPEAPDFGGGVSDNSLQTDPNRMLEKIQQAFDLKDSRSYRACFAEESTVGIPFQFNADDAEAARLFGWNVDDEENYFLNLNSDADVFIEYTPETPLPTPVSTSPDTLQLDFEYFITAEFRAKTESYQGRSVIQLFKASDERWYIFSWRDLQQNSGRVTDSTWSTLKANYRIAPSQ